MAFIIIIAISVFIIGLGILIIRHFEAKEKPALVPDAQGWITQGPGRAGWFLGLIFMVFGVYLTIRLSIGLIRHIDDWTTELILSVIAVYLILLGMIWLSYMIIWVRLRVGPPGVAVRSWRGEERFDWNEVIGVDIHRLLGPRLKLSRGRNRYCIITRHGLPDVAAVFAAHDKPFDMRIR